MPCLPQQTFVIFYPSLMTNFHLTAVSPVDGRYCDKTKSLTPFFSEYALIRYRMQVEIEWFIFLSEQADVIELPVLPEAIKNALRQVWQTLTPEQANKVKEYERTTQHDVKAVEYYLRDVFDNLGIGEHKSFIHFAATSEDINNLAYALMLKNSRTEVLEPLLYNLLESLCALSAAHADVPMMARTHGQPATPTTLGKEMLNFAVRLEGATEKYAQIVILGKKNGAVGNYNAHLVAYPNIDWHELTGKFIASLGVTQNISTIQIEPHDYIVELASGLHAINSILTDLATDIWRYIAINYFTQKTKSNEVGSSTMPHKVNPIDFENAEGNLNIANALAECFMRRLPISRWQRDLTDSTLLRNLGVFHAHCIIAYQSLLKGMQKIEVNTSALEADLEANWMLLAEPIQTTMRRYGILDAYEQLKELSRGKWLDATTLHTFIRTLSIPEQARNALCDLHPAAYIGNAISFTQAHTAQLQAKLKDVIAQDQRERESRTI